MVFRDDKNAPFQAEYTQLVPEIRGSASMNCFVRGDHVDRAADAFVAQVSDLMTVHGGGNMRLAGDKIMVPAYRALVAVGFGVMEDFARAHADDGKTSEDDISRTWWIGDRPPRPDMVHAVQHAQAHIRCGGRHADHGCYMSHPGR